MMRIYIKVTSLIFLAEEIAGMFGDNRAINVIIATVILSAISISFSICAAFWLGGVTQHYQSHERIEMVSCTCTYSSDLWRIEIVLDNKGTSAVAIKKVTINILEVDVYGSSSPDQGLASTDVPPDGLRIKSGESSILHIFIDGPEGTGQYGTLSVGTSVKVILYSSSGMEYYAIVVLS